MKSLNLGHSIAALTGACALFVMPVRADDSPGTTPVPTVRFAALGDSIAGSGRNLERTRRLVHWINDSFTWSATDYQRRTPAEIVTRRSGNCADLASVLHTFLDSLGMRSRWIREINLQPEPTLRRQKTAEEMVASRGNSLSVFGLQHNDHVWLEVMGDTSGSWFPADPAYGVVGESEWAAARLTLSDRPKPRVPAVVPIAADMLVPFVILAQERRGRDFDEDRTEYYLVDQFNRLYGGRLSSLPSWTRWVEQVRELAPHARAAFEGKENLHAHTPEIAALRATYDALRKEASRRPLSWKAPKSDR